MHSAPAVREEEEEEERVKVEEEKCLEVEGFCVCEIICGGEYNVI